ncbi:MAG: hypothetical protein HZB18_02025 [Chloroflexi bacterium]|nr:hypothetical protein [Chloroflexota bacterium]
MKKKFLYIVSTLIIIAVSACGSAEPDINSDDIANTAVAAAWIAITQTQAALPTATAIPPTSTPEPTALFTPTLPPLPIIPTIAQPTAVLPTADICNQVPPLEPKGKLTTIEVENKSQGQVNLTLGMNVPNDKGECVNYSTPLGRGGVVSIRALAGCYWGYAWVEGDVPSVARTGAVILCMTDPSLVYHVVVTKETINFK